MSERIKEISVVKRDGRTELFERHRIYKAIEKAFKAELAVDDADSLDSGSQMSVSNLTDSVVGETLKNVDDADMSVEKIQDSVENQLMRAGHFSIARRYIIYREERKRSRAIRGETTGEGQPQAEMYVTQPNGQKVPLDANRIRRQLVKAVEGYESLCSVDDMHEEVARTLYNGITPTEISKALIFAAKSRIERDPAYSFVSARLLLAGIYDEVLPMAEIGEIESLHRDHFKGYIDKAVEYGRISASLKEFDIERLSAAMDISRDLQFNYMGLQTVYDRYLIHHKKRRIETPQYFFMRVAMGLASGEGEEKNDRAIEFYDVLSSFHFMSSTPTLFNAGTNHPQLSSCYLTTVEDDLEHIFKCVSDDARLSKWAGGLGNDWTNVRALGAHIKGTNGESQGIVPFLKVANDTAVAVNQGGKRKGAMCAYLESWHMDIEDFLELRKNTGDERRRTHDMNTASWIPDLFMKRVKAQEEWTLFSPDEVPDLHHLYGRKFEERYAQYEAMAERGEINKFKKIEAIQLWRKMLSMLFETGHPWITFKDPSNVRSPQDHVGVVHSSNLCTEILLNTSRDETAVCNLGSVNLVKHTTENGLDQERISKTVRTAMRMLDNVIDINYYPTPEAKNANMQHRPVGLGIMGFQDALYKRGLSYASQDAVDFADQSMEMISYYAIMASSELAAERGAYKTYPGSKWDRGILPIDSLDLLEQERGGDLLIDRSAQLDWQVVRDAVKANGMRNSNTMAIAPTATISNICGVSQSIEPAYKHLFAKSNLSGEFAVLNTYMVDDLKRLGLWDAEMIDDLKYFDGSVQEIERIPDELKRVYLTSFEVEAIWLVECASRRQKWIDMGQSLNLYIKAPRGRDLHDMYFQAWEKGLKTTYYLRSMAATTIEKSTMDVNRRGIQPRWMKNKSASGDITVDREAPAEIAPDAQAESRGATAGSLPKACSILDPDCEACQ